jgi:hypothetical protein
MKQVNGLSRPNCSGLSNGRREPSLVEEGYRQFHAEREQVAR